MSMPNLAESCATWTPNVPGREEHSAVLEEGKHAAGRDDLCLARIPVHAEMGHEKPVRRLAASENFKVPHSVPRIASELSAIPMASVRR